MSKLQVIAELQMKDDEGKFIRDNTDEDIPEKERPIIMDEVVCDVIHWGRNGEYNQVMDKIIYYDCILFVLIPWKLFH